MNFVKSVYELSETFMEEATLVRIKTEELEDVADVMIEQGPITFPTPQVEDILKGVILEIVAASVNYCYWYGKSTVRPQQANSTKMYDLLLEAFARYKPSHKSKNFNECVDVFAIKLSQNRFPLLEERIRHLEELKKESAEQFAIGMVNDSEAGVLNLDLYMMRLISMYPGFASDLFLKRASLFFIQLFRRFGWFANDLKKLHVPADYQVPKMLEHFDCISYDYSLSTAIDNNELIPKGSIAECEIRAATVLAIKVLCKLTGWNVAEVDGFFFLQRNETTKPFHLTITTDY